MTKKLIPILIILFLTAGFFFYKSQIAKATWTVDSLEYTTRIPIEVVYTYVDGALSNFPVLVKLTSSNFDFSKANSDGHDIRFTTDDGETIIQHERERHNSGSEVAEYWIKVPSVANDATTTIYMYYRTTDTSDSATTTGVWDDNFVGVWHLNQSTGDTATSSCKGGMDGSFQGNLPDTGRGGIVAEGQDLDGTGDYITISGSGLANTTREIWFYPDDLANYQGLVSMSDWATGAAHFKGEAGNAITWDVRDNGTSRKVSWSTTTGGWRYAAGRYDGTAGTSDIWGNEQERAENTAISTGLTILDSNMIGNEYDAARDADGIIDEVRISDIYRADEWLKATYYSGLDQLLYYGTEESSEAGGVVSTPIIKIKGDRIPIKGERIKIKGQ